MEGSWKDFSLSVGRGLYWLDIDFLRENGCEIKNKLTIHVYKP